jgi:hypothetical protein
MLSKRANTAFHVASIITFLSIASAIAVSIVFEPHTFYFGASIPETIGFYLLVLAAVIAILAQYFLWFGMIWFTLKAKGQSLSGMTFRLLLQLVFLSIGSAIVYLTLYRSRFNSLQFESSTIKA